MNRIFTQFLCLALFVCGVFSTAYGQIPTDSPIPVTVKFEGPSVDLEFTSASYGTMTGWGVPLKETVSGPVAWGFTMPTDSTAADSLGCTPLETDLTGKVALIRRGVCAFTVKAYNAQEAGAIGFMILNDSRDDDAIYNMSTGDTIGALVTIPGVFFNRASGLPTTVVPAINSGEEVIATFEVSTMANPAGPYIYATPQSQIIPLEDLSVTYFNIDTVDVSVDLVATVISPSGDSTVFSEPVILAPLEDTVMVFDAYTPDEIGTYTIKYTNSNNDESFTLNFEITDYTFATDNGEFTATGTSRSTEDFASANLQFHVGSLVRTGTEGPVVTYTTFALANPNELYIEGEDLANTFEIIIYDADQDDDGLNDMDEDLDNTPDIVEFDELTPVATASYILTGEETPNQLLTVPVEAVDGGVVTLEPNHFYYTVVKYDGSFAGIGIPPAYSSTPMDYPDLADATPFYVWNSTDLISQVFDDGTGSVAFVVRTHIDGFVPTSVKEVLEASKVTVMPNLTSDLVNVQFALDKTAKEVQIGLLDFSGKLLQVAKMQNVLNDTHQFNVENLPAGTYFLSIVTPEGYRAEKFVVVK